MAKVNVILTVYNIKHLYLRECLISLEKQTFKDFEVILIDDCSTEDYSYTKEFKHVRYIRNEKNLGMHKSVKKAFSLVNSEYVVRLGSDDIFTNDMLSTEVKFLDNNKDYIACCCNLQKFGDRNFIITRPKEFPNDLSIRIVPNLGYAGGMLFRASALKSCFIDETLKMCEDLDFHIQLMKLGKIKGINKVMYMYRQHKTNLCKSIDRSTRLGYLEKIYNRYNTDAELISILMPIYNTDPRYVSECLKSIKNQTYQNFEIIMYDDGSKFDYRTLQEYKELRHHIYYRKNGKNLGISTTLNFACSISHGQYLVRVDADDILDKDFLYKEYSFLKSHKDYIACCSDLKKFGRMQGIIKRPIFNLASIDGTVKSCRGYGYGCSFMFKRQALAKCKFNQNLTVCEDFDFTLQLLKIGKIFGNDFGYNYRKHSQSTITQYSKDERYDIIKKIMANHKIKPL